MNLEILDVASETEAVAPLDGIQVSTNAVVAEPEVLDVGKESDCGMVKEVVTKTLFTIITCNFFYFN